MKKIFNTLITLSFLVSTSLFAVDTIGKQIKANCDPAKTKKACTSAQEAKLKSGILQCCKPSAAIAKIAKALKADESITLAQNTTGCSKCGGTCVDGTHTPSGTDLVGGPTGKGAGTKDKN